jgi:hypothetical protein
LVHLAARAVECALADVDGGRRATELKRQLEEGDTAPRADCPRMQVDCLECERWTALMQDAHLPATYAAAAAVAAATAAVAAAAGALMEDAHRVARVIEERESDARTVARV